MRKILYTLILSYLVFNIISCDQDIDFPYEGKDRIQFQCYTVNNNDVRIYSDSIMGSLGLLPDSIHIDTLKVVMEYLGKGSDQERTYRLSVVADSTTAVAGTHYEAFDLEQKFRPNELTDTLRIPIYRDNLSADYTNPVTYRLVLTLEPTEDFDLGLEVGITKRILLNNFLTEPDWWQGNFGTTLGYFHPEKWKILMSFNDGFATYDDCPFDFNNEGSGYVSQLSLYLNNKVVIDEVTGKRIGMYELEDYEG